MLDLQRLQILHPFLERSGSGLLRSKSREALCLVMHFLEVLLLVHQL